MQPRNNQPPDDEVEAVYKNLRVLMRKYLSSEHDTGKYMDFLALAISVDLGRDLRGAPTPTVANKWSAIQRFHAKLVGENNQFAVNQSRMNEHRHALWKRFIPEALSILTVFPAVFRALNSYYHYRTFQYLKPESQRAKDYVVENLERVGKSNKRK